MALGRRLDLVWSAVLVISTHLRVVQSDESKHNSHIVHHSLGKADFSGTHIINEVGWIPTTDICGADFHIPKVWSANARHIIGARGG